MRIQLVWDERQEMKGKNGGEGACVERVRKHGDRTTNRVTSRGETPRQAGSTLLT